MHPEPERPASCLTSPCEFRADSPPQEPLQHTPQAYESASGSTFSSLQNRTAAHKGILDARTCCLPRTFLTLTHQPSLPRPSRAPLIPPISFSILCARRQHLGGGGYGCGTCMYAQRTPERTARPLPLQACSHACMPKILRQCCITHSHVLSLLCDGGIASLGKVWHSAHMPCLSKRI